MHFATVLGGAAALAQGAAALNAISVQGQNFVDSKTGDRFEIIGVDYQPGGQAGYKPEDMKDPLSDADTCKRDAALLQKIGANAIRSYNLNPDVNHDACATIFNEAGIYMIIDVNSPLDGQSINRDKPASTYNSNYLGRVFQVIDNFRGYPNTLAFFGANELVNDDKTSKNDPPYIRAVQRDMKQYMKARGGRIIPVGYSAADVREILQDTTNYISCNITGEDADANSKSDFIGVNGYSWCGQQTFRSSNYDQLAQIYSGTTIPVFFSEYGCIEVRPRTFQEVTAIYDKNEMPTFSGGLAYEWTQEDENYGLVQVNDNNTVSLLGEWMNLKSRFDSIDRKYTSAHNDTATSLKAPTCGPSLIKSDSFSKSFNLPKQPDDVAKLIKNGAGGKVTGKLTTVNDWSIKSTVYWPNGTKVSDLSIKRNGGSSTGSDSSTPSSAAVSNMQVGSAVGLGAFTGSMLWLLGML